MHEQDLEKHVKDRYNEINARWLKFHLSVTIGSVVAIFCVEFIMLLILCHIGNIDCSIPVFLLKYIAVHLMQRYDFVNKLCYIY